MNPTRIDPHRWKMNLGKIIRRSFFILLAIVVALCGAAFVFIHTRAGSRLIRSKVIEMVEARTGARIEIGRIALHWTNLGADVYGITAYGTANSPQPPLFQCPHLEIQLSLGSLLQGRIGITNLVLDRPAVHLAVNGQGQTNLPKIPASGSSSSSGISANSFFALIVHHMELRDGAISYNDKKIPLSAEMANFEFHLQFNKRLQTYRAHLRYTHGRLKYGSFPPVEHNAEARFVLTRTALTVSSLQVNTQKSRFTLQATMTDFTNPRIRGHYSLDLHASEIASIAPNSPISSGEIRTTGTIRYRNNAGPSLYDRLEIAGQFDSPQLALRAGNRLTQFRSVRGSYRLQNGNLALANFQANAMGGPLRVQSAVLSLTGQSRSQVSVTWRHASLKSLSAVLLSRKQRGVQVTGQADMDARISWLKNIQHMVVQSSVKLTGQAKLGKQGVPIPLSATVDARYNGAQGSVAFRQSRLRMGNTRLSLNGTFGNRSNLSVDLQAGDLHSLAEMLVQADQVMGSAKPPMLNQFALAGSARFAGRVSGSLQNPRLQGNLSARDLQVDGTKWRSVAAQVDLSPSAIALAHARLVAMQGGSLRVDGKAGLRNWSFSPSSPLSIQAEVQNFSLASLQRLGNTNYPVKGVLSATLSARGTSQHPSGHGTVRMVKVTAWNQPIRSIALDFQGNGQSVRSTATVQTAAGSLQADLRYLPANGQYNLSMHSAGLRLDRIQALRSLNAGIAGQLVLSANGQGTLANPQLSARISVSKLTLRGQSMPGAQARLDIAGHRANFTTELVLDRTKIGAKGSVALTGEYETKASLNAHELPLGLLLARYWKSAPAGIAGSADVQAEVSGPLKDPAQMEVAVNIPALRLAYSDVSVSLVRPLRLDYRGGVATLQPTELKGKDVDLHLKGTLPVQKPGPMDVALNGTVGLGLFHAAAPAINSSGEIGVQFTAKGSLQNPTMQGHLQIQNASFSSPSVPVNLAEVNGRLSFAGDRIEIDNLSGRLGGGSMSAQGFVIAGGQPRFNLAVQANSVGVNYPRGLFSLLNANLQFNGTQASSQLSGRVIIEQMSLSKQFDLTSLASQFSGGSAPLPSSSPTKNVKLNVSVQSAGNLNLVSSQLSMQGGADLTLTGTLANPVVLGRATLQQGEIFFYGRRYQIQSGTVEFSNPVRNDPILNVYATTTAQQYTITMNFSGPLDRMTTHFTSDPPLPTSDIIRLIAFGSTSQEAGAAPATPSVLGAESVLAKAVASQFSGKLQRIAGISQLTINPLIGGNQTSPGAQITVQQRVTGRLLLTFTTDTTRSQDSTVQVQYQATHHFSVTGQRSQYGAYSAGIHFHKSF